jgi:pimeloyl-ACP methyl ester carboxylesterase
MIFDTFVLLPWIVGRVGIYKVNDYNGTDSERKGRRGWEKNQPRMLVAWGKYDLSFDLSEPAAYQRDVPNAQIHILDGGHFSLDAAAEEIADLMRNFVDSLAGGEVKAAYG